MSAILQAGKGDVFGPTGGVADGDLAVYNGTSGKIIKSLPRWDIIPAGTVIQTQSASNATFTSAANSVGIPQDDTIPQVGEGVQILSVSITPQFASSAVLLTFSTECTTNITNTSAIAALFRGGVANAIGANYVYVDAANHAFPLFIQCVDSPATTSAITYTVRIGPNTAVTGTMYINGSSTSRLFGGALKAMLLVQEIKA